MIFCSLLYFVRVCACVCVWVAHIEVALKWHNQTYYLDLSKSATQLEKPINSWCCNKNIEKKLIIFSRSVFKPIELYVSDVCYWSYFSKERKKNNTTPTERDWRVTYLLYVGTSQIAKNKHTHTTVHKKNWNVIKHISRGEEIFCYQNAGAMVSMKTDDIGYGLFLCMHVRVWGLWTYMPFFFLFYFGLAGWESILYISQEKKNTQNK